MLRALRFCSRPAAAVAAGVAGALNHPALSEESGLRRTKSEALKYGEGALHRLDPGSMERGRALKPGRVNRLYKPTETQVVRIALTGGPCAGKSSSLAQITEAATAEGFDVYAAPETATLLMNCGFKFPAPDDPHHDERVLAFQKALFKTLSEIRTRIS